MQPDELARNQQRMRRFEKHVAAEAFGVDYTRALVPFPRPLNPGILQIPHSMSLTRSQAEEEQDEEEILQEVAQVCLRMLPFFFLPFPTVTFVHVSFFSFLLLVVSLISSRKSNGVRKKRLNAWSCLC
jgi:hypothetical protein